MTKVAGAPLAPYPDGILARGWTFDLDYQRLEQSETWTLAAAELKPWLLMVWFRSWANAPCGTYPDNDAVIAARIGMPGAMFRQHRDLLLSGWVVHADGRLYHPTITELVLTMIARRAKDRQRVALSRIQSNQADRPNVRADSARSPTGVTRVSDTVRDSPSPSPKEKTRGKPAFDPSVWVNPSGVQASTWALYIETRRTAKASGSAEAFERFQSKLHAVMAQGFTAQDIIAQSADRGWIDPYAPRTANGSATSASNRPHAAQSSFGAFDTTGILDSPRTANQGTK